MSYYNPNPYQQPVQPTQPANTSSGGKEKWSFKQYLAYIIIPGLTLLATAGFFTVHSISNSGTSSIPILHATYTGTFTDLTNQRQLAFSITNLSEDTNTGNFTASAVLGFCTAQITNGQADSSETVTFVLTQEPNFSNGCTQLTANFNGHVNSAGSISGNWSDSNGVANGSFNVS